MIDKPSPSFEMALQQELRDAYLKGVETGYRRAKEELQEDKTNGLYDTSAHSVESEVLS